MLVEACALLDVKTLAVVEKNPMGLPADGIEATAVMLSLISNFLR